MSRVGPRGRRLLVQLALVVFIQILALASEGAFVAIVSLVLLPLPVVNWTVAAILEWTSRQAPEVESLRNRADDAITLALISTLAAIAGGVAIGKPILDALHIALPSRPVLALIATGLVLASVPAVGWLRTWRAVWLPFVKRDGKPPTGG